MSSANLAPTTPKERAQIELSDLEQKRDKLATFINSPEKHGNISGSAINRMYEQLSIMNSYVDILQRRLRLDFQ